MASRAPSPRSSGSTPAKTPGISGPAKAPEKKGRAGAAPAAAPEAEKPKEPAKPVEVVSLIDDPKPRAPRPATAKTRSRMIPVISTKLRTPEPEPAPAPEPSAPVAPKAEAEVAVVAAEPVAAAEAAVEVAAAPDEKIIHIKPPIIVKDLAHQMGVKAFVLIKDLMELNVFANINQPIEADIATKVCAKHGFKFEKEKRKEGGGHHKVEAPPKPVEPPKPKPDELLPRAPVVTFMGHVDHGKTSLMDCIRKARVAAGEAGGITQHIGAYSVERDGHKITFLDTPGHEAFTAMRARGAMVTDIVVLVVAADDGLMPQTLEAISHAKAAKVAIVVALNKIDLPGANVERAMKQLQDRGLTPEDWGGDTLVVPVSALKGTGVEKLLESILLQAELLELKASAGVAARATIIEAQMEAGRGATGTVVVREGTLKIGQPFTCGDQWGKVKSLVDSSGKPVKEAGPSMAVKVIGFAGMPNAGDELKVADSEREAREHSEGRLEALRTEKLTAPTRVTLETLLSAVSDGQKPRLKAILKADVQGSLEAITQALHQIDSKKVDLEIIHSGVGPISESDINLAAASNAVVIGFSTKTESTAAQAAKREAVQIKLYSIIYELIDQIKDAMAGLLEPETRESAVGHAEVRKVFDLSKGKVAGCLVTNGRLVRNLRARVLRGRQPIYDGGFATLKRFQEDAKEVRNGLECGVKLGDFSEYQVGDVIECYQLEKIPQKL